MACSRGSNDFLMSFSRFCSLPGNPFLSSLKVSGEALDPTPFPKGGVMYSSLLGVEPTLILWAETGEGMDSQIRKENGCLGGRLKGTAIGCSHSKTSRLVYFTFN